MNGTSTCIGHSATLDDLTTSLSGKVRFMQMWLAPHQFASAGNLDGSLGVLSKNQLPLNRQSTC